LFRSIGEVFSNGAMLSASGKSDSVNKCTQEIDKLVKLHILGCGKISVYTLDNWLMFDRCYNLPVAGQRLLVCRLRGRLNTLDDIRWYHIPNGLMLAISK